MTTEERLDKLEKKLSWGRRFKRWLLVGLAEAIGAWLLVVAFPAQIQVLAGRIAVEEVRARRFAFEDGDGKIRAVLSVDGNGEVIGVLLDRP